ncbi:LysR family transcriptional regulator [Dyella acidiphila]|uniref:LysR family transcriptional regulator n=1 Tax=Dyella acidiphila TaxID=2775866 RepID=A0ABR9GCI3_9GAMM|nr:LysR family transcriptional regulator [Dyella acidiphila]MBE1161751.1 LysR family transcriptional regulator [Dyella acidiphila]
MDSIYALNLRHLAALSVIARAGSMSAAAEQVSLSQPALAQAIGKLERLLDIRLFERQAVGVHPTVSGQAWIIRVERALRYLTQAVRLVRRSARLAPLAQIERRVSMVQLRALVAVEHCSSYAVAAEQIGLSQPAVYRAVQELQDALGAELLVRAGRAVRPTDLASRFVRFVRLMLAELRTGLDEIAAGKHGGGRISIGTLPMARPLFLPDLLARFAGAHPAASVEVREAPYGELLMALRHGDIDLVIGGALREPAPANDVEQEHLFDDELFIVGNSAHPLRRKGTATIQDLLAYPWAVPALGVPMRRNWETLFRTHGVEPPTPRIECGSVLVTRGLMLKGEWLTLMSLDQFLFERQAGALAEIPIEGGVLRRRIVMTRRSDWRPTAMQEGFAAMAHAMGAERMHPLP